MSYKNTATLRHATIQDVPVDLWKQFKARAALEGLTIQKLFVVALRYYLDNKP